MKIAVEHQFSGTTQSISSYDSTKTLLGSLIQQKTGATSLDKFVGPLPISVARPMEAATAVAGAYPSVIPWSSTKHWVFLAENSAAAVTRRIVAYEYDIPSNNFTYKGFITLNFALAGNKTINGFRAVRTLHTTGTVGVSGTAVTGSGTGFSTQRIAVGARIGFGSNDPTAITTWYQITAIGSDTGITLGTSAPTFAGGTAYVIEELRFVVAITNATPTNGGLFLVKGCNIDIFNSSGLNIAEATTVDNIRAIYWLADAVTVLNTTARGLGLDSTSSNTQHFVWVLDGTTTARIFKYDIRASLTSLSAGRSVAGFVFSTGTSATLTGTLSATNNGRITTCSHGPGSGVKCFYFVTTTRVYRVAESAITTGSTTFLADSMAEIPPGGANTFILTNSMASIDYSDSIDRFIILTTAFRGYLCQYNTNSNQFEQIFLSELRQTDQSTADSDVTPFPSINATGFSVWSEGGIFYLVRNGVTSALNQLYAIPCGADWQYASSTNQFTLTPAISLPNCNKLQRVYVNHSDLAGADSVALTRTPFRIYYRTSGISDNTGSWTLIPDTGIISGAASQIQFKLEFRIFGDTSVPSRIYNVGVVYEDTSMDSHYQPSVAKSSAASKIFAARQVTAWGSNIPNLRVLIYNAATNTLLLDDTVTNSANGTWQYSTDGNTWLSWSAAADSIGNYIRYTPTSLASGITARFTFVQA